MAKYSKSGKFLYINPIAPLVIVHKTDPTTFVLARESLLPVRSMNCKTFGLYIIHLDVGGKPIFRKTEFVEESDTPLQ